jgi:kynureninase
MTNTADYAVQLDCQDELAGFRDEFIIGDSELIYLDGNSLGRLPKRTVEQMRCAVERQWGHRLVRGWNEGWFTAAGRIGAKIAQLIGAEADEVVVTDSTSVNLFKLATAAIQARPERRKVVSDELNFPSDLYVLQGAVRLASPTCQLVLVPSLDGISVSDDSLRTVIDSATALVALTHTSFKSGFVYDMAAVTEMAHRSGALVLWDLCHSVGVMPLQLNSSQVDLAVGCTYKYLNGGPGAPAFLYVRRDLQEQLLSPIWGWFGRRAPFDFKLNYEPALGIERFQAGTPPMLSLLAAEPGIDLVLEAGVQPIRTKSIRQTEYLIALWQEHLEGLGLKLNSPRTTQCRGSHVSFGHADGFRIARALIRDMRVIPDFREPDNLRFGISPLYTTFAEIHQAVNRTRQVIERRLYEQHSGARAQVT